MESIVAHQDLHRYQRRSMDQGIVFTALFATIAIVVILCCLAWGFVIPYIRKMYFPPEPSLTKYNRGLRPYGSDIRLIQTSFRNHQSAVNSRNSSTLSVYNSRLHTPFPAAVSNHEFVALRAITPPRVISSASAYGEGLFTPVRERVSSWPDPNVLKSYTLPRVRARHERVESAGTEKVFGDAREYILALPEPLRLRSRTHAGGLVASNTLDCLPDSSQLSTSAEKTMHPNKLFEQLRDQDPRNSNCSSTSLKRKASPEDSYAGDEAVDDDGFEPAKLLYPSTKQDERMKSSKQLESTITTTPSDSAIEEIGEEDHNASVAAMHRLRTYRSLVGAPPPEPLSRAGTLTRPKTSVAKLRDMYDRSISDSKTATKTISRNDTISTFLENTADASDRQSTRSSATSPPKVTSEPFTASSLSLVPTPLRVHHESETRSYSSPARRNSKFTEELNKENESSQHNKPILEFQPPNTTPVQRSRGFSTATKPRPAPLTLTASSRLPGQQRSPSTNNTQTTHKAQSSHRAHMPSIQASSIYSRDTQGISIAQTPSTPNFAGPLPYLPPFSPYVPSTTEYATESDKGTEANLVKPQTSPTDTAKAKVENWNVDIDVAFDTSPSASLKRAISSLGPETHVAQKSHLEEDNRYSTISTDLAPSEARLSSVAGPPLRMSSFRYGGSGRRSNAPGGAEWI